MLIDLYTLYVHVPILEDFSLWKDIEWKEPVFVEKEVGANTLHPLVDF